MCWVLARCLESKTLPETNMTSPPQNGWDWNTSYYFPIGVNGLFSGANLLLVSGRVNGLING